ncbi:hypothetical protein [Peterkaempfera bronchialis]|uniref:Uncharacterized protein n=1 Tax=Peterkaempfera bronchialis TaxID=2126346 RepID=A0A345SVC1_9ACTN|nr:hypothetical protein [Peterkaempfera bronchialis]AXI77676.1 hypothetical protein C7M71_009715 [Peterkaempfera bronchialis]
MSLLTTLARLEAVRSGRAQPLATVRHRHLSDRPMVVVPLTAAGEDGAPLAAMLGTDRDAPRLHVVAQPLDRDQRFAFLAALAADLLPYLEGYGDDIEQIESTERDPQTGERTPVLRELCADAPQLIVPNGGGIHQLGLLGRSTRFRRTADDADAGPYPVPTKVPLLGRWLTHLRERSEVPGSSLLLAMTALLGRHWATGQSHLEDQHLGAQLAWIAPPPGLSGAEAALHAETARDRRGQLLCPPAGPATDPRFDEKLLGPAVTRHDAARAALRAAPEGDARAERHVRSTAEEVRTLLAGVLRPTWDQVWQGIDLLRTLPPADHLPERWESDRWSYTGHRERLAAGEPPQPRYDDAVTAARKLAQREREQAKVELQEALDDPLAMAECRLAGEAFAGTVVHTEPAYDTSGRSPKPRPLVTVRTDDRPHADPGREVHRAWGAPRPDGGGSATPQKAEIVRFDPADGTVVLRLTSGMGRRREPEPGTVPQPGERVCFTLFELTVRQSAPLPDPEDTPWTHGGPPGTAAAPRPAAAAWADDEEGE